MTGKVIGKDKWSDLAVVKAKVADENIKPMTMGDSNNIKLAEPILVIGNPLSTDFKGSVSQVLCLDSIVMYLWTLIK